MHVALLFEFGSLNGGEHSMLASLERLAGRFAFTAIAPEHGRLATALDAEGVPRIVFDVRDAHGARKPCEILLAELRSIARELRPDVLHANSLAMARWTGALTAVGDTRRTGHLRDIVGLSGAAVRDLNGNDRLVAVSQATRDYHVDQGLGRHVVDVIHNGVDLDRFRPRPPSTALRHELELPEDAIIALTIGQIGLRKAQDVLSEAVVRLADPRLHLVLVGERLSEKAESIAFERGIHERFERAGLRDRLHVVGYRSDVPTLMNQADLLVHPAKQEPLGRVLLEAAASGLPIVATNVGGTPEILDESSALLVPPGDVEALAAAVATIVVDRAPAERRAHEARRVVERRFSAESAAERLGRFWENVVTA